MVRYTGRARTRTGSVNTNQLGLKMSGCPSTVGRSGRIARHMGRRVDCMMGLCKPIRYHEVLWPRTRMRNQKPFCKPHATKCQAAAGGVGTNHNIPYYRTPKKGESGCTPAAVDVHPVTAAVRLLQSYLSGVHNGAGSLILVGKKETLTSDDVEHPAHFENIIHYHIGTEAHSLMPRKVREAANVVNSLLYTRQLKLGGPQVAHVVGYESFPGLYALMDKGYGNGPPLPLGPLQSDAVQVFGLGCGEHWMFPCTTTLEQFNLAEISQMSAPAACAGAPLVTAPSNTYPRQCMTDDERTCLNGRNPQDEPCGICKGVLHAPQEGIDDVRSALIDTNPIVCDVNTACIGAIASSEINGALWPNGAWLAGDQGPPHCQELYGAPGT